MLDEAVSFATDDDDLLVTYLIGSVLLLASFVVGITIIPLYGYYLQVLDAGRTGSGGLPEFDDWETLIIDGLKMFVVNLVYTGIPGFLFGIVASLTFFGVFLAGAADSGAVALTALVVGGLVSLVLFLLALAAGLLVPAALARMRVEDEVKAAFEIRKVIDVAKRSEYLVAVVVAYLVGLGVSLVGFVFSLVLIGLPILFFGGVVTFHIYGQGYARAVESMNRETAGSNQQTPA